jgi:pimeloyl-ACP methyl ester carboxylesterase
MYIDAIEHLQQRADAGIVAGSAAVAQSQRLTTIAHRHGEEIGARQRAWAESASAAATQLEAAFAEVGWARSVELGYAYLVDAWQRGVLAADILRQRANILDAHDAAGAPPVLCFDYDVIVDGRTLKRPVNYKLLSIRPPAGVEAHAWKRPYMIIDPRAGHGPGISGFKPESQVGVALHGGHPVYLVMFEQSPEPGQTIADVMRAEAKFYKEIVRRHPDAPQPAVVGNCQGGWATLLLAATNPTITGPIVINGAPLAAWSGVEGRNPMRYSGGLLGGALPAMIAADLGAGRFDGANLVLNFEAMNPARNWFRKYYDLFADPERGAEKFLEFERWWGGFYFLNEAEIRWILDNIFVGNRLSRGEARLERGRSIDLKAIRAPIIVFASQGDNITPPQQALNWIVDTYADEREIKIRGQRIIYMVHESVGHLGIFVSSSTAKKEHREIVSVLKMIETLAPGLYEMIIEEKRGDGVDARFEIAFEERRHDDILALSDGGRANEADFGAVARLSELAAESYDLFVRPLVRSLATPALATTLQAVHPMRMHRHVMADRTPGLTQVGQLAEEVKRARRPTNMDNPFRYGEALIADLAEQWLDMCRSARDAWFELAFIGIYGTPFMRWVGQSHSFQRTLKDKEELRHLPEVQLALAHMARGSTAEAVIRMLILLAESRGSVRCSRLDRAAYVLGHSKIFSAVGAERRARMIREQTLVIEFDREGALGTLVDLVPDMDQRAFAMGTVDYIVGPLDEMAPQTVELLQTLRRVLQLPELLPAEDREESAPATLSARSIIEAA